MNIYNIQASRSPNLRTSSFATTESSHFKRHDHRIFAPRSFLNCRGHSLPGRGTPTQEANCRGTSRSSNLRTKKLPQLSWHHSLPGRGTPTQEANCRWTSTQQASSAVVGPPLKRHSHNCRGTPTQQASSAVVGPPLKRHSDNCRETPTQEITLLNMHTPTLCAHSRRHSDLAVELLPNMRAHSRHPTQEGILKLAV